MNNLMTNLVWDDTRIDELAELVNNTVWQYLEQFEVSVDAFKVAHETEVACKESLINALVDAPDAEELAEVPNESR